MARIIIRVELQKISETDSIISGIFMFNSPNQDIEEFLEDVKEEYYDMELAQALSDKEIENKISTNQLNK